MSGTPTPRNSLNKPEARFFAGDYQGVLTQYFDHGSARLEQRIGLPVIGSLALLGRRDEAAVCFDNLKASLSPDALISARYFLGLAALRTSDYDLSRRYFTANLKQTSKANGSESLCYVYLGLALQRYYRGQFISARVFAKNALRAAIKAGFTYGRALAADLFGHLEIQSGDFAGGFDKLTLALTLAKNLRNSSLEKGIEVSLCIQKARLGLLGAETLPQLQALIGSSEIQDVFSRVNLLMEMARQQTLRGQWKAARESLNSATESVFKQKLRRHENLLNLRFAELLFQEGRFFEALNYIAAVKNALLAEPYNAQRLQALGMELKLLKALDFSALEIENKNKELFAQSRRLPDAINQRILRRNGLLTDKVPSFDSDIIGDLKDRAHEKASVDTVISSGLLSLLLESVPVRRGEEAFVMDLLPGTVTLFGKEQIFHISLGKLRQVRSLLRELARGPRSKKELVEHVWGYRYERQRHDSMVYASIQSCRQSLGPYAAWLETTENGYSLKPGVRVVFNERSGQAAQSIVSAPPDRTDLNYRQLELLGHLGDSLINAEDYKIKFDVSRVTASRDLNDMVKKKLLGRIGRARATHYRRKS